MAGLQGPVAGCTLPVWSALVVAGTGVSGPV